jgi:hypothetical protein
VRAIGTCVIVGVSVVVVVYSEEEDVEVRVKELPVVESAILEILQYYD